MKRNGNDHNRKKGRFLFGWFDFIELPGKTRQWCAGIAVLVVALVFALGFFNLAGIAGNWFVGIFQLAVGKAAFALPVVLLLAGIVCFASRQARFGGPLAFAVVLFALGVSGLLADFDIEAAENGNGGYIGYYMALLTGNLFGQWVAAIFFGAAMAVAASVFWWLLGQPLPDFSFFEFGARPRAEKKKPAASAAKGPSLIKKVFDKAKPEPKPAITMPKFTAPRKNGIEKTEKAENAAAKKNAAIRSALMSKAQYKAPPLDLLDERDSAPLAGDVNQNSAIIKKTLENFGIPVEMSPEIVVGPAVTQYALKPAEGVKLSKITALSSDLSLALAS